MKERNIEHVWYVKNDVKTDWKSHGKVEADYSLMSRKWLDKIFRMFGNFIGNHSLLVQKNVKINFLYLLMYNNITSGNTEMS